MSKRGASNYLTQDNFDDDEEEEQGTGVFTVASSEVIQNRVIKKARRRMNEGADTTTKNTFQGFSFGTGAAATSGSGTGGLKVPSFNFNTSTAPVAEAASKTSTASSSSMETVATEAGPEEKKEEKEVTGGKKSEEEKVSDEEKVENGYLSAMRQLNEGLISWVTGHVGKSPHCILSPIFDDYNKYVKQIDEDWFGKEEKSSSQEQLVNAKSSSAGSPKMPTLSSSLPTKAAATSTFSFGTAASSFNFGSAKKNDEVTDDGKTGEQPKKPDLTFGSVNFGFTGKTSTALGAPTFSFFGQANKPAAADDASENKKSDSSPAKPAAAPTSLFSFLEKSDKSADKGKEVTADKSESLKNSSPSTDKSAAPTGQSGFSFQGVQPFSFGTSTSSGFGQGFFSKPAAEAPAATGSGETAGGDEEGEYEPPKAEVVETTEEGSFYTTRCKLYYKKGDKFEERGLGHLHLKPNGSKTQLVVRTDTALGNILLNINVEKVMPVSRQGSNNVTIICIPNPPLDPKKPSSKPIPMLIRVKSATEADELHKQLTECQAKMM